MKRYVIAGGTDINNYEYIRSRLQEDDFIVFCDSGLKHLEALQVKPNLIVYSVKVWYYITVIKI